MLAGQIGALLAGPTEKKREGIALIKSSLLGSSDTNQSSLDWIVLASAVALNIGDLNEADELAKQAFQRDPTDTRPLYLERIIDRERQLSGHN
jgi:hypothetical protein